MRFAVIKVRGGNYGSKKGSEESIEERCEEGGCLQMRRLWSGCDRG